MDMKVIIERIPKPGDIGSVVTMHGNYYSASWGFTAVFEAEVAEGMGAFFGRYDPERDLFLAARVDGRLIGSLTIDGRPDDPADARVRWVILEPAVHGTGIGRQLMDAGMAFAAQKGYHHIYLDTFRGLDAALAMYHRHGFVVTHEHPHVAWGAPVTLMRMDKWRA